MTVRNVETDRFTAVGAGGRNVELIVYTDIHENTDLSGELQVGRGFKALVTADGQKVNFVSEGVFQIVATGEILRKR